MVEHGGAGGYGTTSTLNQDSRGGKYYPHVNIFCLTQHPFKLVRCYTCNTQWTDGEDFPQTCKKDNWDNANEILKG